MYKEKNFTIPITDKRLTSPVKKKCKQISKKKINRTSLVAQWLRIHLPMQGHGFEPWSGKIPHTAEQLSLCATTTEPAL